MLALVIDDSRVARQIVERCIRPLGFEAVHAADGDDGLAKLAALPVTPDAVFIDWNMPGKTGLDVVRAVRADPKYDRVPLVMVTSESEIDRVVSALEAGANEYVMKPFTAEAFQSKLELLGVVACPG